MPAANLPHSSSVSCPPSCSACRSSAYGPRAPGNNPWSFRTTPSPEANDPAFPTHAVARDSCPSSNKVWILRASASSLVLADSEFFSRPLPSPSTFAPCHNASHSPRQNLLSLPARMESILFPLAPFFCRPAGCANNSLSMKNSNFKARAASGPTMDLDACSTACLASA